MSREEFLYGEWWLPRVYLEAETYRFEQANYEYWLQGLYNYKAFHSIMDGFAKGFSGKNGKAETYYEYPISITDREKKAEKQRNIKRTLEWVRQGQESNGII